MTTAKQEGFEKGFAAYEKYRPSYSEKSVKLILEEIVLPKKANSAILKYDILELGAGSGKLTELVAPKIPPGYRYLATELSESEEFFDILKSKSLPIKTANAVASCIPLPDNSVQTVLCGTCLHWFSDAESLKEIHRVLVPGGKLIALTYAEEFDQESWTMEIYKQRLDVCERFENLMTKEFCVEWEEVVGESQFFTAGRKERNPGKGILPGLDSVMDYVRTLSYYECLPEEISQSFLTRLKRDINSYPDINQDTMTIPFIERFCVFVAKK